MNKNIYLKKIIKNLKKKNFFISDGFLKLKGNKIIELINLKNANIKKKILEAQLLL